jgi:hypothetical protein
VGHLWLEFRPNPLSGFGDQVSPHVHHERTTLIHSRERFNTTGAVTTELMSDGTPAKRVACTYGQLHTGPRAPQRRHTTRAAHAHTIHVKTTQPPTNGAQTAGRTPVVDSQSVSYPDTPVRQLQREQATKRPSVVRASTGVAANPYSPLVMYCLLSHIITSYRRTVPCTAYIAWRTVDNGISRSTLALKRVIHAGEMSDTRSSSPRFRRITETTITILHILDTVQHSRTITHNISTMPNLCRTDMRTDRCHNSQTRKSP